MDINFPSKINKKRTVQKEQLWQKTLKVNQSAIDNKSLIPIETTLIIKNDYEIKTLCKPLFTKDNSYGPNYNPFRPWDKNLEVTQIGQEHIVILNKYPVEIGHLLLITRGWQPQNGWLSLADFKAITTIEKDIKGLWFFNSSSVAGASQPHRHIQLLRRKFEEKICPRQIWFENFIDKKTKRKDIQHKSIYVIERINKSNIDDDNSLYDTYIELCSRMKIGNPKNNFFPLIPYNLLITEKWFALIRRSKERYNDVSINALGFAGYFLAKTKKETSYILEEGIDNILDKVVKPVE